MTGDGSMNAADGHGGGDAGLMDAFIEAVATMISRNLAKAAGRLVALHGHDRGKPKLWHHPGWVTEEHTRAYIAASEHGDPGSRRLQRGERESILT
ncbi:hypothetical protein GCM10010260_80990 [Streptomyces filipinensis]|uniref:Uncharacterized protein n=1 Tax=Streptomyces filipinensis TaxID=66887 RepID=A0A918IMJ8_9ACTN|nr:hypothetical protein GCM10010260_80990 [Streptomyces filipinensis]